VIPLTRAILERIRGDLRRCAIQIDIYYYYYYYYYYYNYRLGLNTEIVFELTITRPAPQ